MQTLEFSHNWNNKLDCDVFTTLRLSGRFSIGEVITVQLNKVDKPDPYVILDKKVIYLSKIGEWIARIDTGYSAEECIKILKTMYSKKRINWDSQPIYLYLIKRQKPSKAKPKDVQNKMNL